MKFKNLFTLLVAFVLSFSIGTATLPAIAETATEQSYSSSEVLSSSTLVLHDDEVYQNVELKKKSKKKKKSTQVYVTRTGKCYHTHKCGRGNYYKVSLSTAKSRGLRKCKKCY